MRKKILSVLLATFLLCSASSALFACKQPKDDNSSKTDAGATLSGLYVTGGNDATLYADSNYTIYNHGSTTAATDETTGAAQVKADSTFRVTKEESNQTYESVFWRVTNWSIKYNQFAVTVKNNLETPVNVRIILASVDGAGDSLGPTNVHHGDGYASDTNYTLGGGASRTYRVIQDTEALYDIVSGEEKELKGVYMRFNTHGTMLGAADVTITKATLAQPTSVFDIADFAPLYGSNNHKTLTSLFNSETKTLSSALYMGATSAYSEKNWGFDSQTSAWDITAHRYLHYKLTNIDSEKTNLETYGVTLLPVKGTGSSADNIDEDINLSFTADAQTITGVIDLNNYPDFTTLRIMINDREGNPSNVPIPDGIYVAIEAHIIYSNSATAAFGTLPTLSYTIPDMPAPPDPTIPDGDGDLSDFDLDKVNAVSVADKATITITNKEVVEVDTDGVINKLVVTATYNIAESFNPDPANYTDFAGVSIDTSDLNKKGLTYNISMARVDTDGTGIVSGAVRIIGKKGAEGNISSPRGELTAIPISRNALGAGNALGDGTYADAIEIKFYLSAAAATSGTVQFEFWFIVPSTPTDPDDPTDPPVTENGSVDINAQFKYGSDTGYPMAKTNLAVDADPLTIELPSDTEKTITEIQLHFYNPGAGAITRLQIELDIEKTDYSYTAGDFTASSFWNEDNWEIVSQEWNAASGKYVVLVDIDMASSFANEYWGIKIVFAEATAIKGSDAVVTVTNLGPQLAQDGSVDINAQFKYGSDTGYPMAKTNLAVDATPLTIQRASDTEKTITEIQVHFYNPTGAGAITRLQIELDIEKIDYSYTAGDFTASSFWNEDNWEIDSQEWNVASGKYIVLVDINMASSFANEYWGIKIVFAEATAIAGSDAVVTVTNLGPQ